MAFALVWVLVAAILSAVSECACPKTVTNVNGQNMAVQKDDQEGLVGATQFFRTSALPLVILCTGVAFMTKSPAMDITTTAL